MDFEKFTWRLSHTTSYSSFPLPSPSVSLVKGRPATTSLEVAKFFGKRHDDVLKSIRNLCANCPENFTARNFAASEYTDETGRSLVMFILYRDGFMLLVMGYTGKKAMQIKIAYIEAFNQMEAQITGKLAGEKALATTTTPSTAADRKPLRTLVSTWSRLCGTHQQDLWPQVRANFQLERIDHLPTEWIPDAIAWVQGKIDALAKLEATPEQKALPGAAQIPVVSKKDLPSTARLFEDIRKAGAILEGTENWTHISVRRELCRDVNLHTFERSVDMHVNAAWYALGLAKASLLAALTVGRISKEFTPNGAARA